MKPSIQSLGHILYSPSQYVIPVFQRNYRWEAPQWEKVWNSLQEIQQPGKTGNHFMGFLVFVPGLPQPGQHVTFHLIDGQQRLTTLSLVLAALRNVAREEGGGELADEIHEEYLVHPRKKGDQRYRLLPKERDQASYLAIIDEREGAEGRLAQAVAYFEDKLEALADQDAGLLRSVFETVKQRFEFMCATLESENAYNIFKSLNSTGVPLGPSDLIRNFVFMHVPPDDHDEFDRSLWDPLEKRFERDGGTLDEERFSRFFRDFLMCSGRYVSPKETFSAFEERFEATGFAPDELAATLVRFSAYFEVISGEREDSDRAVTKALVGLNALESSTTIPLLLWLFEFRSDGRISSERLSHAIEMLRGFILRRFICSESSRGYGQMFVRAIRPDAADPVADLEAYLLERGWPDVRQFQAAFAEFPLYQRDYARHILEATERSRGHREPADLGATEVEHILPQTLNDAWRFALGPEADRVQAEWLHRPGNLTLSAYNRELWNHEFPRKRVRYAESNIGITRELGSLDSWGEDEIAERGKRLAREAAAIWIGPEEPFVQAAEPEDDEPESSRRELKLRFWEGVRDHLAAPGSGVPDLEPKPYTTIRLQSGIRHIGFETRVSFRHRLVAIDVWFWRQQSLPVWEMLRASPAELGALVGEDWVFEKMDGRPRALMSIEHAVPGVRDPSSWPDAQHWFSEHLPLLYERVALRLRALMAEVH